MTRSRALALFAVILAAAPSYAQSSPTKEEVLYALQDASLTLDSLQVRSTLATDVGGSALLQLRDGTLIDVRLAAAADSGFSVRDISMVAGSGDTFRSWTQGWRARVDAAENFLAGVSAAGRPTRTAEELAALSWFEDPDQSTRLWGMNPVTYRMMQALQMMPTLQGPTGGGTLTNPVPRQQQ